MKPQNSIIIITYNQKDLIGRAIDSVLCQSSFIYEIIISDDCSTDGTWNVIKEYKNKYPELIKAFRNNQNLGIFGNQESTWSKVSGNVIYFLSGDDVFCDGLFEKADSLIVENGIDCDNDFFTLYFDWKSVDTNGVENVFSNRLIMKHNAISLKLRNLIHNRTTGIGRKVFKQFYPVRKDLGIITDELIDIQTMLFSKINLYCPYVGSIYYMNIGIASRTSQIEKMNSYLLVSDEILKSVNGVSKSDKNWLLYRKYKSAFNLSPNLKNFLLYLRYLFCITEIKYGKKFVFTEVRYFGGSIVRKIFQIEMK